MSTRIRRCNDRVSTYISHVGYTNPRQSERTKLPSEDAMSVIVEKKRRGSRTHLNSGSGGSKTSSRLTRFRGTSLFRAVRIRPNSSSYSTIGSSPLR